MQTTLILTFEKHELRIESPEAFITLATVSSPEPQTITGGRWQVSLAPNPASSQLHQATTVTLTPPQNSLPQIPPMPTLMTYNQQDAFIAKTFDAFKDNAMTDTPLVHSIFTPRTPSTVMNRLDSPLTGSENSTNSKHTRGSANDSGDGNSDPAIGGTSDPLRGVSIPNLGELMAYSAVLYRSPAAALAQSVLEVTYRPTGRLAWSRLCARLSLSKNQSERAEKEAMVALVAARLAKSGIITESFPPEGARRVWLLPLEHSETSASYAVIAKSRGRKVRAALKETFPVTLLSGKRGKQHDHLLVEILARSLWWLSVKPVELVMLPKPLFQDQYWIEDYGWGSITSLVADCNTELGASISLRTHEQFMDVINQKK
eukprot:Protomagalhaensia_sp_Gyna_25__1558@NODE_1800_length_1531_cov_74_561662_g1477_i0_p1_GENE_NODE_1800_length_1531_cov_74_561662_g1477_i0NODE_1800_length_1531_cov_74_561662_g1477_i0_p1_ORF_typecomplete_len374_score45_96_NODE_1800_length_1531_cov_74_561662_g1477_i01341255